MYRSSLPEISPFTCRLEPSRAITRSAVGPAGRIASLFILGVLSQNAGVTFVGWVVCKLVGSESGAFGVSGFLLLHIGTPSGRHSTSDKYSRRINVSDPDPH